MRELEKILYDDEGGELVVTPVGGSSIIVSTETLRMAWATYLVYQIRVDAPAALRRVGMTGTSDRIEKLVEPGRKLREQAAAETKKAYEYTIKQLTCERDELRDIQASQAEQLLKAETELRELREAAKPKESICAPLIKNAKDLLDELTKKPHLLDAGGPIWTINQKLLAAARRQLLDTVYVSGLVRLRSLDGRMSAQLAVPNYVESVDMLLELEKQLLREQSEIRLEGTGNYRVTVSTRHGDFTEFGREGGRRRLPLLRALLRAHIAELENLAL